MPEMIIGLQIGRLTIISEAERYIKPSGRSEKTYKCKCSCGNVKVIRSSSIKSGVSKSCGCLQKEVLLEKVTTHGMSYGKIYGVYQGMKQRCNNPKHKHYKNYGGRGITVCDEWKTFDDFYNDMGESYVEGLSIERKDADKGYCKENCEWIPKIMQAKNKRDTLCYLYNGVMTRLIEICDIEKIDYTTTRQRIVRDGKTLDQAIIMSHEKQNHN